MKESMNDRETNYPTTLEQTTTETNKKKHEPKKLHVQPVMTTNIHSCLALEQRGSEKREETKRGKKKQKRICASAPSPP